MFRIIKFLFTGVWHIHQHEWETVETTNISYKPNLEWLSYGTRYTLRCKTCGEMKTFTSSVEDR